MIRLEVSYRGIILIGLALATLWALTELWPVILLVLTSLIIMIGVLPYVEALVARGIPRGAAVLALVLAFIVIVGTPAALLWAMTLVRRARRAICWKISSRGLL